VLDVQGCSIPSLELPFTGFTATPTAHTVQCSDEEDPEMTLPLGLGGAGVVVVGRRQKVKEVKAKEEES
jgi:hypothetical protein